MVTTRINIKKINEKKHLDYLESWYCPLERSKNNHIIQREHPGRYFSQLNSKLKLNEVPLSKQVMAGS